MALSIAHNAAANAVCVGGEGLRGQYLALTWKFRSSSNDPMAVATKAIYPDYDDQQHMTVSVLDVHESMIFLP